MHIYNRILGLFFIFIIISSANAELNIISDYGGNSMGNYYDMLDTQDEYSEQQNSLIPEHIKIDESLYLPVYSEKISPGKFESYHVDYPTLQPFIIIGADPLSIEWLTVRANDLDKISGIVGVAVNINDMNQLNVLKSLTNIPLYAMPGDELAERFQLKFYPALISSKSIEQ